MTNRPMSLSEIQSLCHQTSRDSGWWKEYEDIIHLDNAPISKLIAYLIVTKLCLIHSEISEGMEGYRKKAMDSHLPHRASLEVELADAMIRIFDLAGFLNYNLEATIIEKLEYNRNREDHKLENRNQPDGKKF